MRLSGKGDEEIVVVLYTELRLPSHEATLDTLLSEARAAWQSSLRPLASIAIWESDWKAIEGTLLRNAFSLEDRKRVVLR